MMGEGSDMLEEMMDLLPTVQEPPRCHDAADSGFGAGNSSAPFDHRAPPVLPRTASPDLSLLNTYTDIIGSDHDGDEGILDASSHLAPAWDDWSHESRLADEQHVAPCADGRHLERDEGGSIETSAQSHFSSPQLWHSSDKEKFLENGVPEAMRRSTRERKQWNRFDPVAAALEDRPGGRYAPPKRVSGEFMDAEGADAAGEGSSNGASAASARGRTQRQPPPLPSTSVGCSLATGAARRGGCVGSRQTTESARMERGKHVGSKPQMQRTARAGQAKWKQVLKTMRTDAEKWQLSKDFEKQMSEVRACV